MIEVMLTDEIRRMLDVMHRFEGRALCQLGEFFLIDLKAAVDHRVDVFELESLLLLGMLPLSFGTYSFRLQTSLLFIGRFLSALCRRTGCRRQVQGRQCASG